MLTERLKLAGHESCWVTVIKVILPNERELPLTGIIDIGVPNSNGEKEAEELKQIVEIKCTLIKTRLEEQMAARDIKVKNNINISLKTSLFFFSLYYCLLLVCYHIAISTFMSSSLYLIFRSKVPLAT